jgi:hypothetical protein
VSRRVRLAIIAATLLLLTAIALWPTSAASDVPVVASPVPASLLRSLSPVASAPATVSPSARLATSVPVRIPAQTERAVATTGIASWWASFGPGIYAALPGYVAGTHVTIRVWSGTHPAPDAPFVDAVVITSCGCFVGTPDERIADLSSGILRALGLDQARGLFRVTIERSEP